MSCNCKTITLSDSKESPSVESGEYPFDLGAFGRKITTSSPASQVWFNRGLTWVYAFNHMEGVKCFQKAIAYDPKCAMAYWGIAYALGPNYNHPWDLFDEGNLATTLPATYEAAQTSKSLAAFATPVEQALINAISVRFQTKQVVPVSELVAHSREYMRAMEGVYRDFGDDLDVVTLYADSMMSLTPWGLYDEATGQPTKGAFTLESKDVLERGQQLDDAMKHPGLLHLYIHLSEMSPNPERALSAAEHLRDLVPDAGHTHHMPTHLDVLVGDYRRAISSNIHATLADEKYLAVEGPNNFYSLYRLHNYHSLIYAAMHAGKKQIALETADRMERTIPAEVLRSKSPNLADWLEGFVAVRLHVMVRFGMWCEIIAMPLPEDQELYCVTTATIHYAKGVAYAATNRVAEAEQERKLYVAAIERVPITRRTHPNRSVDILNVGVAMLDGEIEYRRGEHEKAFQTLRRAIELDDGLNYAEPWGWMQPVRHAFAALSLEQGYVEAAAEAYKADLGLNYTLGRAHHHPNNVWALQGYYECLVRLSRDDEARLLEPQVKVALAVADVPVKSSCFCRLNTSECPDFSVQTSCCR
ncbi:hypothetical protein BDV41DRAFT_590545 [Aspergillus transmontanensis]|uniref:TPR domain protein n=1 Tax=Aspergillus transmontanensis TaxID=1034304 RepID=A0A5N6VNW0_9EURO|nr:hypothetical protein BDV41DRAFT_590545 [Aspergillus transmontanensis]